MRIQNVVVDCYDAQGLAQFWAAALGVSPLHEFEEYVLLGGEPAMAFQTVPEPTPGKNRLHVDLHTDDIDGETSRLLDLGATLVGRMSMRGGRWVVLADPEGNQFCIGGDFDFDHP